MQGSVYLTLIMYFSIALVCDCGILDFKFCYHLEDQQLKLLLLTRSPHNNKSPHPPPHPQERKKDAKLHLKQFIPAKTTESPPENGYLSWKILHTVCSLGVCTAVSDCMLWHSPSQDGLTMKLWMCVSGGVRLCLEKRYSVHKGKPKVPPLEYWRKAVWVNIWALWWCKSFRPWSSTCCCRTQRR